MNEQIAEDQNDINLEELAESVSRDRVEELKTQVDELMELIRDQDALLKTQLLKALQDANFARLVAQAMLQVPEFPQLLMARMAEEQMRHDVDISRLDIQLSETEVSGMEKLIWFDSNYAVPEHADKVLIIREDDEKLEIIPALDQEIRRLFEEKGFAQNQPFWVSIQPRPQVVDELDPNAIGETVAVSEPE